MAHVSRQPNRLPRRPAIAGESAGWLALRSTLILLAGMGVACTSGCGGGDKQPNASQNGSKDSAKDKADEAKKKTKDKKKKKPEFEIGQLAPRLSPVVSDAETDSPRRLVKPGHWTSTVQPLKANYEDFVGRAEAKLVDTNNVPLVLTDTPFTLSFTRPVVLAKGRQKFVEGELLIPADVGNVLVHSAVYRRDSYSPIRAKPVSLIRMPSFQYFLLVLAKEPGRYGFLKVADAVRSPWEDEDGTPADRHYQVLLSGATKQLPLSANALTWTSLAYLVWDEVDPTRLSPGQQQALIDWLHWGGRLIVNGPDSLDTLKGSFLDKYLPAEGDGSHNVTAATLRPWNAYWSRRAEGRTVEPLSPTTPWSAVRLKPRDGAVELLGTAQLFYERSVGHGSILVSGVQLSQRDLVNWPGFDSFLNAVILRRPSRRFSAGPYGGLQINWAEYDKHRLDAHFTTGLRYFARDQGAKANWRREVSAEPVQVSPFGGSASPPVKTVVDRPGGMAAWGEFSPAARAARKSLREAAGVRVPSASFVVVCLAVYLLVLVPLNWMVFHTLRRVEWAWIAAPIIAILSTILVVRQAQLDIGFVRAQTEIAVLELESEYPRGHLSRYTALYTSLSTTYDLQFGDQPAVAAPFPVVKDDPTIQGRSIRPVAFVKHKRAQLQGLAISSVSTHMVHSEQMLSLDGPLWLGESSQKLEQVVNRTGLNLDDVMIVRRRVDNQGKSQLDGCWLGQLRSGQSSIVGFSPMAISDGQLPYANQRKQAALAAYDERLNLDPLLKLALQFDAPDDPQHGMQDEYRLLARIDQVLPGTQISPPASQTHGATLVVAHLRYGQMPPPQPDINSRKDVAENETVPGELDSLRAKARRKNLNID